MTYHHGNLRKALLDRAAHVIAEQGIESLNLRALARDLGVSHAAPSRHFADKADLLRALATEGNDRFIAYILEAADATGNDPLVRYNAMGKAFIRFSLLYPAYYRAITHPDVAKQADASLKASAERRSFVILDAARKAQEAGWLTHEKTEDVMLFSIATVRGVSAMLADPMSARNFAGEDRDELIARMVRLIIDPEDPGRNSLSARKEPAK